MIGIANVVMAHWVRTSHEGPAEPLQGERPTATTELHQAGVPVGPMADALSVMVSETSCGLGPSINELYNILLDGGVQCPSVKHNAWLDASICYVTDC